MTNNLLPEQLEQLQKQFNDFMEQTRERLGNFDQLVIRLEVQVQALLREIQGNGQPGRCARHSQRLSSLERDRAWIMGAVAGIGALLGVLGLRVVQLTSALVK